MAASDLPVHKCANKTDCMYYKAIYLAMYSKDLANIADAAYTYLKVHRMFPVKGNRKSEDASHNFREKGDLALDRSEYVYSLKNYNAALVTAPPHSDAARMAYSRRSYLFYVFGLYEECLRDIETLCCSVGCTLKMFKKELLLRIKSCKIEIAKRKASQKPKETVSDEDFFVIKESHPDIPSVCASVAINEEYRAVAARDIGIGSVVAVEKAYNAHCEVKNWLLTCHYCKKLELNLHPCDGCPFVMFCNEECRIRATKEYHVVECPIMCLLLYGREISGVHNVVAEAIMIMKGKSTWGEFITASRSMGRNRLKKKSTRDNFDVNSKFSLLGFDDEKVASYSKTFNHALACAKILHFLCVSVPFFFPKDLKVRNEAIRAVGRVFMGMCMYIPLTRLDQKTLPMKHVKIESYDYVTMAMFSFIGKLRNECDPNLLVIGLNNAAALVAVKPIKAGQELTISYLTHWSETIRVHRGPRLYVFHNVLCKCRVCRADWNADAESRVKDMECHQAICIRRLKASEYYKANLPLDKKGLKMVIQALQILGEIPHCSEYLEVLDMFKVYIQERMQAYTKNMILQPRV